MFKKEINGNVVCFRELNVREYKHLLKNIYGDDINENDFFDFIINFFEGISDKSKEFFKDLSLLDLFSCIVFLRANTLGNIVQLYTEHEKKKYNISLDLNSLQEDIQVLNNLLSQISLSQNNISINFQIPSYIRNTNTEDEYLNYIKSIKLQGKTIEINDNETALALFERLPMKITYNVIDRFKQFATIINDFDFFERYSVPGNQTLGFIPNLSTIIWYTKLFFSESLQTFYDNIFYLSYYAHMDPAYIESCTPGEYTFFVKKLEQQLATIQQSEQGAETYDPNTVDHLNEDL